jgi:hypothetical protein
MRPTIRHPARSAAGRRAQVMRLAGLPGRPPTPQGRIRSASRVSTGPGARCSIALTIRLTFLARPSQMVLISLYLFRSLAIAVYVLMGLFTSNYILSIVIVVVLLSMDFWNTRNVCGRTLVGLRYWNQVDEDGESAWVFESRDVRASRRPRLGRRSQKTETSAPTPCSRRFRPTRSTPSSSGRRSMPIRSAGRSSSSSRCSSSASRASHLTTCLSRSVDGHVLTATDSAPLNLQLPAHRRSRPRLQPL